MHQKSIWKGITIFSLALGIGTFTGDSFKEKEITENVSNNVETVEKKNCRFADPNLQYQKLPLKNENYSAELLFKTKEKKKEAKEPQNDTEEFSKLESQLNDRSETKKSDIKNKEEYSILLHKEICSE
ncbi:MAG TPA: hypothetical protein PKY59_21170 [Pyrinomonadaceae bacterium]|nr:hypothetical protein [Pyrinomonadaceae bacterium]